MSLRGYHCLTRLTQRLALLCLMIQTMNIAVWVRMEFTAVIVHSLFLQGKLTDIILPLCWGFGKVATLNMKIDCRHGVEVVDILNLAVCSSRPYSPVVTPWHEIVQCTL